MVELIKEYASLRTDKSGSPKWIYFKGVVQCFECGWWTNADTVESGVELWHEHDCKPDAEDDGKE